MKMSRDIKTVFDAFMRALEAVEGVELKGAELSNVARECPQDSEIQRRNFYRVRGSVSANDRYMRTSVDAYRDASQIVSEFADWIYRALEEEYGYQMSDECVDGGIRANEYEFDEDGGRA